MRELSIMNRTSRRNTIANGATSSWPRKIRALRGNFMGKKFEIRPPSSKALRRSGNPKSETNSKLEARNPWEGTPSPHFAVFASQFQTFGDDVDDFGGGAFHVEHDRIYAADEVVVSGVGGDRD